MDPVTAGAVYSAGISAIGKIAGGIIGQGASDDASKLARQQLKFQRLAAKKSIQWRVKDAIEAGIHPIYALGAPSFSPSPISVSGSSPMGEAVASMGQDLGGAVESYLSRDQRAAEKVISALQAQGLHLDNNLKQAKIEAMRKVMNMPDLPGAERLVPGQGDASPMHLNSSSHAMVMPEGRPTFHMGPYGSFKASKGWSKSQLVQDWFGDIPENLHGFVFWLESMFGGASSTAKSPRLR